MPTTDLPPQPDDAIAPITFRMPARLKERVERRICGQYSSVSEYLRDLIRRDLGEEEASATTLTSVEIGS